MGLVEGATLERASKSVTRQLVDLFDGDLDAASQAVEEIAEYPDSMSAWATRMIRMEEPFAPPFSFDEIPDNMKSTAARGMAMAYLTYTMTPQDRRVS